MTKLQPRYYAGRVIRPFWQELCDDMLTELEVFSPENLF